MSIAAHAALGVTLFATIRGLVQAPSAYRFPRRPPSSDCSPAASLRQGRDSAAKSPL
jgi:hypothetical protein